MVNESNNIRVRQNLHRIKGRILSQARRNKDIIFGAQSIKKQIGILARPTKDIDAFTEKPKTSAIEIEKFSDRITRGDNFFLKKGRNPETWKVKGKGKDGIRGTEDDFTLVDYTKTPRPKPKTTCIDRIRYRTLQEEKKAKEKILRDPKFRFRRKKDKEDLKRINFAGKSIRKGFPCKP